MEYKSCFRKWVDRYPLFFIIMAEVVTVPLFALLASLLHEIPYVYVFVLVVIHILLPWILREEVSDKDNFDKLFDAVLSGILIAGITIAVTVFELNLIPSHFVTNDGSGDFKFIGLFYALQKLSTEVVKVFVSYKKYKENYIKRKKKTKDNEIN